MQDHMTSLPPARSDKGAHLRKQTLRSHRGEFDAIERGSRRFSSELCSRFALSVRVSLPLMLAVVGILPLVIWLADLLPPLAGMA